MRTGVSAISGQAAYAAGTVSGAAIGTVTGAAIGGTLGTVGGATTGAMFAGLPGVAAGGLAGLAVGTAGGSVAGGLTGARKGARTVSRLRSGGNPKPVKPGYGGGAGYQTRRLAAGALGGAAGAFAGSAFGPAGTVAGGVLGGGYWARWSGQQQRLKRWLRSEAGQKARADRAAAFAAAKEKLAQSGGGIRNRLKYGRRVTQIQQAFEQRAIREANGN
jgi:hypothetical protein